MNITNYTEFKDIKQGEKFIDSEGHEYTKISGSHNKARHYNQAYRMGYMDYEFAEDDRLRVQG